MTPPTLTSRELNRAILARQMLLERSATPVVDAIGHLVGLQAQAPREPYVGLWTRLRDFGREDLTRLLEQRQVVKATMMRGTLHIATADDYLRLRPELQPMLTRAYHSILKDRTKGIEVDRLVSAARAYVEEKPRTFTEIRDMLADRQPGNDARAMGFAVRMHLPLVQVPDASEWGFPSDPVHANAETWLGTRLPDPAGPRELILRYLAAFGPATVAAIQAWSGLNAIRPVVDELKPILRVFRDERGRELLDIPDAPTPPADTPAPPRFLPEYDNLVMSHVERGRVAPDEYRRLVSLPGLRIQSTILVDGYVRGAWKIERSKRAAALVIEPFEPLPADTRDSLGVEGERLMRFVLGDAGRFEIRFADTP